MWHIIFMKGMSFMNNALIVGGDMRSVCLAREFKKRGFSPLVCGIDAEKLADAGSLCDDFARSLSLASLIILPLPVTKDGVRLYTPLWQGELFVADVLRYANKDALICGGRMNCDLFREHALMAVDYAARDDFASLNAVPTAEGAIEAVMKLLPVTIFSSSALVTGFGKTAKVLALTLKAMGANVTVCARSVRDRSLAEAFGLKAVHLDEMHLYLPRADIVFNTIAHRVFFARELDAIREHTPFADLASAPGGADADEAKARGINYLFLPGLPGKYSPVTAAQIIFKTITNIGKEANLWNLGEKE